MQTAFLQEDISDAKKAGLRSRQNPSTYVGLRQSYKDHGSVLLIRLPLTLLDFDSLVCITQLSIQRGPE